MSLSSSLVAVALATCIACSTAPPRGFPDDAAEAQRAADQLARSVAIVAICPDMRSAGGTGVIVRGRRVLTALHVINCGPDLDKNGSADPSAFVAPMVIMFRDRGGHDYVAHMVGLAGDRDIAALEAESDIEDAPPPAELADAGRAGRVCFAPGLPQRGRVCGEISGRYDRADLGIYHTGGVTFGNSGSGLYDGRGRLVGIVTHCDTPRCVAPTGGYSSPTWPVRWMVE